MIRTSVAYWNARNRMLYAPPDSGAGAGAGEGEGQETQGAGDGNDTLDDSESGEEGEINVDGLETLNTLFGTSDEEDEDDPDSNVEILTADQIKTYLDDGLKKVVAPESLIPDDFNPNDKASMTALLSSVMQLGVRHALNLSFRPIENAMKSHAKELRADVRARVKGLGDGITTKDFLSREIPASANPKHSALVKTVWAKAIETHPEKKDRMKAVALAKKGLQAMGINPDDGAAAVRKGESGGQVRTGLDALNLYAPIQKTAITAASLKK